MYFVEPQYMAGVGFRWGILMALLIPFLLLAQSFSSKTRSKISISLNPHQPPIFACKSTIQPKSRNCLGEALQHHRSKHMPQISPVPSHYAPSQLAIFVNSFLFSTLGRLYSKPTSSEKLPTITDFVFAVSLADFSLWATYYAWDGDWIEAEEGDEADWIGEKRHETPLKPYWLSTWAKLPGFDGRLRMARFENSFYTHVFASTE